MEPALMSPAVDLALASRPRIRNIEGTKLKKVEHHAISSIFEAPEKWSIIPAKYILVRDGARSLLGYRSGELDEKRLFDIYTHRDCARAAGTDNYRYSMFSFIKRKTLPHLRRGFRYGIEIG